MGTPLATTLAALPFVVAGFALLAWWARRRGARALPRPALGGELVALAVLLLAALGGEALDLPGLPEVVYCGLVLVMLHHCLRQLLALRPLLGRTLPARPSPLFLCLPLLTYLALIPWASAHRQPDGDEPYYLLITHSLAYDFDADLTDDYAAGDWRHFMSRPIEPQPGDPRGPRGELFSRHNELLPLVLAPAYRVAGKAGALATMAALTAALAWMVLRLGRRYFPTRPGEVMVAYAIAAWTPPLLLYSYQVWVEVPAALLTVIALDRVLAPEGWKWKRWLGVGLPILLLPLLKIRLILLAGPLLAMAWLYAGRPRRPLVVIAVLLALLGGGILAYNQWHYGNPLKVHSLDEAAFYRQPLAAYGRGMGGFFFDAAFGLFAAAPLWMLLVPAIGVLLRRGHVLARHLLVLAVPYLALVAPRSEWYGGWSPPFRYALVTLPLCAVALVPLLAERRRGGVRFLFAGLAVATLGLGLLWVSVPGWTYNFADGRTLLLDRLSERFGADLARFFASSVRPRPATWLWPLAAVVLLPAAFWLRGRSRASGAGFAGIATVLFTLAALPWLARQVPTRTVELEDPAVSKQGGHPEPERWTFDRTRFRGAWVLREGESLRAPVVAGGDRVQLRLETFFVRHHPGPLILRLRAGERSLVELRFDRAEIWERRELEPLPWNAGEPLVIDVLPSGVPGQPNGILLDRVRFDWR